LEHSCQRAQLSSGVEFTWISAKVRSAQVLKLTWTSIIFIKLKHLKMKEKNFNQLKLKLAKAESGKGSLEQL